MSRVTVESSSVDSIKAAITQSNKLLTLTEAGYRAEVESYPNGYVSDVSFVNMRDESAALLSRSDICGLVDAKNTREENTKIFNFIMTNLQELHLGKANIQYLLMMPLSAAEKTALIKATAEDMAPRMNIEDLVSWLQQENVTVEASAALTGAIMALDNDKVQRFLASYTENRDYYDNAPEGDTFIKTAKAIGEIIENRVQRGAVTEPSLATLFATSGLFGGDMTHTESAAAAVPDHTSTTSSTL